MCAFLHVWSHLPWKPCFISFDVLLVDVVFQAPFFHMFETMFSCIPLPSGEKISHPETAQSKGLRHHGLGHKWKTIGEIIWNVELIVDLPRSLVLWLDLDSQKTEPSIFFKGRFQQQNRWMTFLSHAKNPPKNTAKTPRYQPARSESRHHHHHGIHTCPKRTQPFHLPYYWLSAPWNHWRDPNENEYASSGSSSLKKRGRNMTYVWKFVIARLHLASFQASSANCGGSHHGWQEWQHYWYQQCLSLIDTL